MRRIVVTLAIAFALLIGPAIASATLLTNVDSRDYELKLQQGSGSVSTTVKSGKSIAFRCSAFPCKVTLTHNKSSMTIRNDREDVIIRDGRLTRRETVAKK